MPLWVRRMKVFDENGAILFDPLLKGSFAQHGLGLFETLRFKKGQIENAKAHYERMIGASKYLSLKSPLSFEDALDHSRAEILESGLEKGVLKWRLLGGETGALMCITHSPFPYTLSHYENGAKLKVSSVKKSPTSLLVNIKSLNYLENRLEREKALALGFNEALFLNTEGHMTEGAASNLFFIKDSTIYTPDAKCGLLEGTMRHRVISYLSKTNLNLEMGTYPLEALYEAEEAFITNALMGVMGVFQVEDKPMRQFRSPFIQSLEREFSK